MAAATRRPARSCSTSGAGTGHHLAGVLDALPGALGIALDTSRPALRHAVRAHADIAAVVADVWQPLPVADATIELVLDVFSPRNGAEMARVLKPGGVALVVIPTPSTWPSSPTCTACRWTRRRSSGSSGPSARTWSWNRATPVRWTMDLTAEEVAAVLKMSPAGAHRRGGEPPRAATVTGSVELWRFRRPDRTRFVVTRCAGSLGDRHGRLTQRARDEQAERDEPAGGGERLQRPDVVGQEADQRRPGQERDVADRRHDAHAPGGVARIVARGAHPDREPERGAEPPQDRARHRHRQRSAPDDEREPDERGEARARAASARGR